jgi:hypothetical protein
MVTAGSYAGSGAQLDIGRVISRTFGTLGANIVPFFLLALIFAGIPNVAVGWAVQQYMVPWLIANASTSTNYVWMGLLLQLGVTGVLLLPTYILIGALTHGSIVHLNGGRATFFECLGTGLRLGLPLVALGLLTTLGIYLFALLLIIPGIMAATRWAVAAPALVIERTGVFDAFGRSEELVQDNRWRIFWLMVIWVIVGFLIQLAVESGTTYLYTSVEGLGANALWLYFAITGVYSAITNVIGATGTASLYYELRTIKEGATSEELAKVFD